MTLGAPQLLILFAALLYLYDATIPLFGNEGLLTATSRKSWRMIYQPNGLFLVGRVFVCPNPLLPHRPLFRLSWLGQAVELGDDVDWTGERKSYRVFIPLVYVSALLIFVLLPVALLMEWSTMRLLVVAGAIYLCSFITAAVVVLRSERLRLSRKKAWSLALECVLCPPITVNIVRRISLAQTLRSSVPAAGLKLLGDTGWTDLKGKLLRQLDDDIETAASEAEKRELRNSRQRLAEAARAVPAP